MVQVVINELQADNSNTIINSLGNSPGWVELFNPTSGSISLQVCTGFDFSPVLWDDTALKSASY